MARASSNNKNDGFVTGGPQDASAKSLLHALSEIEQLSVAELRSSLPEGSMPMQPRFTFIDVACKNAALMTLSTFITAPFSIAVVEHLMPAFGNASPSLIDKIYVYLFSCAPAIAFSILITSVISRVYTGKVTSKIVNYFTSSYVMTKMMLSLLLLLVFAQISHFLTSEVVWQVLSFFNFLFKKAPHAKETAYLWMMQFREILIPSAVYATIIHLGTAGIISAGYIRGVMRTRRIEILRREWE